jgi:hypothetical protein
MFPDKVNNQERTERSKHKQDCHGLASLIM